MQLTELVKQLNTSPEQDTSGQDAGMGYSLDKNRSKYDPILQDVKQPDHFERVDVFNKALADLQNLELFLSQSNNAADIQLLTQATELSGAIRNSIKATTPAAAAAVASLSSTNPMGIAGVTS